jgi:hypothetical protein
MHPLGHEGAFSGRSRSASPAGAPTAPMAAPPPVTYFLADEKAMEASLAQSSPGHARSRDNMKHSNFGVQSMETTLGSLSLSTPDNDEHDGSLGRSRSGRKRLTKGNTKKSEEDVVSSRSPSPHSSRAASRNLSPLEPRPRPSPKPGSLPLTPMTLESPTIGSIASSPSSRRNSEADFTDDMASQAIQSSGDEERDVPSSVMDSSCTSQLVMPSITMPSRRPFTERGKNLGKLKVLIAGDSGTSPFLLFFFCIVFVCGGFCHH